MKTISAMAFMLALLLPGPTRAETVDLHALWHDRCQACHGHAGAFARSHAPLPDTLETLLSRHRGGLAPALARGVAAMLRAEAAAPNRFATECRICHGPAAPFVRGALAERDGRLVDRYSGRDIATFLSGGHGRLDGEGAAFFTAQLRRILGEVRYEPD